MDACDPSDTGECLNVLVTGNPVYRFERWPFRNPELEYGASVMNDGATILAVNPLTRNS